MEKTRTLDDGPPTDWDFSTLPDWDDDFYCEDDILAFASALSAPETSPSEEDLLNPNKRNVEFITALNDWAPVRQAVKGRENNVCGKTNNKRRRKPRRGKDETREGWSYTLAKWPLYLILQAAKASATERLVSSSFSLTLPIL